MRVNLEDDRQILIEFAYDRQQALPPYDGEREVTVCILRDGSAPRGEHEPAPAIVQAEVTRYYLDPPNREKSRKAALKVALREFDLVVPWDLPEDAPFEQVRAVAKARNKLFWDVYLNRKGRAVGKAGA